MEESMVVQEKALQRMAEMVSMTKKEMLGKADVRDVNGAASAFPLV